MVTLYTVSDQNHSKTIPVGTAHTNTAYIGEPLPPPPPPVFWHIIPVLIIKNITCKVAAQSGAVTFLRRAYKKNNSTFEASVKRLLSFQLMASLWTLEGLREAMNMKRVYRDTTWTRLIW